MKFRQKVFCIFLTLLFSYPPMLISSDNSVTPVTPNASPEVQALLKFIRSISGTYTLTGQHNYPNTKGRNSQFAAGYTGKTPVVFSTDWGFAKEGDKDSYRARPDIVEEVKRQHRLGSIITICWHAVPPTANEPVVFSPQSDPSSPDSLATVQGQLPDRQFKDLLTPGTSLYNHWCAQVDTIAVYLKQLQDAHIPILWRPYHEMNGDWFWWGGRRGEQGTAALYRQLFERLTNHHKFDNLIWVWSVDRPKKPEMQFKDFFPGSSYLDILSLDVYGNEFVQSYYDSLIVLSEGKPLMLAEVGNPPSIEILKNQPKWSAYVIWAGMVRNTRKNFYTELLNDQRVLCVEDTVFRTAIAPYREVCGLPPLPFMEPSPVSTGINFSGEWVLNEETSILDNFGVSYLPSKLTITQNEYSLTVRKAFIIEYGDDIVACDTLTFDGKECVSEMWNRPRIMKARWSEKADTLIVESKVMISGGGKTSEMVVNESWNIQNQGRVLSIQQFSDSFWGKRTITMMFDRK
jgi:mannan endo-1,4-beta-mannosidase